MKQLVTIQLGANITTSAYLLNNSQDIECLWLSPANSNRIMTSLQFQTLYPLAVIIY